MGKQPFVSALVLFLQLRTRLSEARHILEQKERSYRQRRAMYQTQTEMSTMCVTQRDERLVTRKNGIKRHDLLRGEVVNREEDRQNKLSWRAEK